MNAAELTVVIVGTFEMHPVADVATSLRRRDVSTADELACESVRAHEE